MAKGNFIHGCKEFFFSWKFCGGGVPIQGSISVMANGTLMVEVLDSLMKHYLLVGPPPKPSQTPKIYKLAKVAGI